MMSVDEDVVVAFASDDAYLPYLYVAAQSAVFHASRANRYVVLVLYLGEEIRHAMSYLAPLEADKVQLRIVDMRAHGMRDFYVSRHISLAAYCRLYLPSLFPEYNRVLYLDCDILVRKDLADIFFHPMPNAYIAACLDMSYDISPGFSLETECYSFSQYVNSGVVLFDLAAMRRDNIQERLLECAAEEHMMHDQSVLNIVCAGHVAVLPEKWNFCLHNCPFNPLITKEARERSASILSSGEIGIIHYCSPRKPWAGNSLSPLAHLWWQEAERAPCCL